MICPCCRKQVEGEYFHVLATRLPDSYRPYADYNYCCTNCLAERLRVPRHIKFVFTPEDKEVIRKIVREEIAKK